MQISIYLLLAFALQMTRKCEGGTADEDCLKESDPMGATYSGTMSQTENGNECQRWDTDKTHKRHEMPKNLDNNYCRNPFPDAKTSFKPWCYTTVPGSVTWEYCDIKTCESNWCLNESNPMGATYSGTISVTEYGSKCQRWDTDEPHKRTSERGIPKVTDNNYCRNPKPDANTSPKPWCYTTDPDRNYEYCELFVCEKVIQDCLERSDPMGTTYSGTTYIPFCDSCEGLIYDNKCFTAEDVEECKRQGGLLANLYSEFHMIQVMNYLRKKSGGTSARIGLKYDPVADKISLRDGTDAPAGLRWHPQAPSRWPTTGINMGVIASPDPSDNYQYLMNTDRESSSVICETVLQK